MTRINSLFMAGLLAPLAISACVYVDEGSAPVREVVVEREVLVTEAVPQDDRLNAVLWAQ